MRLKHIKLAGFKSFVDPTTVTFPGNRCSVVGPNGCGKSNIIDAVRWVMGESSAKQLRGENLTDVIFNGSNSRKPTSAASIELIFDNSAGRIGGEYAAYAEISIRRQVTRDAQSAYFLNGSKCRRRDILDIFLGTGFGPRTYSIIEQGMISQLVEAKPEELRVYLEEAAGVSKYKERRRETEKRIRHTNENLERIKDIREELGRQLDRLQRQAKAAVRYRELKEEERRVTAELHVLRLRDLSAELDAHRASIRGLEIELARHQAEQRGVDADIEKTRVEHAQASEEFNRVQGEFYQLGGDIGRIEEAIQFNTERVQQLELDLEGVSQRGEETARQLDMDRAQIDELNAAIAALNPRLEAAHAEDDEASGALSGLEARDKEMQSAWDEFAQAASANEREAEVQTSRIDHLEQLLQRLRPRLDALVEEAELPSPLGSAHVDELAEEIESAERNHQALEFDIDRCLTELGRAREEVLSRERVLDEARGEVQGLRHELASLEAVQRAALGRIDQGAEIWLTEQGLEHAERLGESLSVAPGWERAVEMVLGEFLQALRVKDVSDYAAALVDVTDGHVTLIEERVFSPSHGELPDLASLVVNDELGVGSVLHGVFAAEATEVAMSVRDTLHPGQSAITREGFWVGPDWIRKLPVIDDDSGIIQRAQELETLTARVEEAEKTLTDLQLAVTGGRARVEQLEQERESLQARANLAGKALGQLKTDHGVRRVQLEEEDARRVRIQRDRADIESQIEQESSRLAQARAALGGAESKREAHGNERERLTAARQSGEKALMAARESARGARDRFHALNAEREGLASRLTASQTAHERLVRQVEELLERQEDLKQGIESSSTPLPELQSNLESKLTERLAVEQRLSDVRTNMEALDARARQLEMERAEKEACIEAVRSKLETARVETEGLNVRESNLLEQIQATGHDAGAVAETLPEEAAEAEWAAQLERVDRRIQRLGAINLAAIEEYEAESERKTYLDAQHEDLVRALDTLLGAIRKIDRETKTRFKATFERVNEELERLFPKMFGGGHAYLELTGEDLLDTGVTLMARPPGKRNSSIHLLSGGEKAMTAVALIFAIFHLNPSPVCLLDEVDAPLDDSNVQRFAELIREMSEDVQFVVITHNKITMEMADHLMGVTMHEPGVSRLVSVDVDEAARMAAS
ncbi:MAG: chromosome segregation protein SMC [Pseudomonadales bacterium]|nr:chromosome segregation protein SMC [Pseudomonadales bacterium]MDP6471975.1 chromosome segregation protein SMC [Pseudomonadales bacterium]MDP6826754.1 chromosome segregation protein SMC [Pseudomonadales bacterium]MDP6971015.1 chromosome segregation protein SMC [Pseudomonadales bacterium]